MNTNSKFEEKRLEVQHKLEELLGCEHVYFQPPENVRIAYPAIIYTTATPDVKYADNYVYSYSTCFTITYVRKNHGDDLPERIVRAFQYCKEDRTYVSDSLYHTVFKLYV